MNSMAIPTGDHLATTTPLQHIIPNYIDEWLFVDKILLSRHLLVDDGREYSSESSSELDDSDNDDEYVLSMFAVPSLAAKFSRLGGR